MIIRHLQLSDRNRVLELGTIMHAESAYAFLPFKHSKVIRLIGCYLSDRDSRCALVAEQDGNVVGVVAGYLVDYFFCDQILACDEVLFIDPAFRGGTTAVRLIRGFQQWAIEKGARELCLGISTDVAAETTGRLYQRLGFKAVGGIYKLRLD